MPFGWLWSIDDIYSEEKGMGGERKYSMVQSFLKSIEQGKLAVGYGFEVSSHDKLSSWSAFTKPCLRFSNIAWKNTAEFLFTSQAVKPKAASVVKLKATFWGWLNVEKIRW